MERPESFCELFYRLNSGAPFDPKLVELALSECLAWRGAASARDALLGSLLSALVVSGPRACDVIAAINAVLSFLELPRDYGHRRPYVSKSPLTCVAGSGKKGVQTFNVSTLASIVASAQGVKILKLGSAGVSSVMGSADFMRVIGVDCSQSLSQVVSTLDRTGFGFVSIESLIPRFDQLYGGRFYVPTILSFGLPAVVTPLHCDNVFFGLAHSRVDVAADVLRHFGFQGGGVVCSTSDGVHFLDELSYLGSTSYARIGGAVEMWASSEYHGLPSYSESEFSGHYTSVEQVSIGIRVLQGCAEPAYEDLVCMNAAMLMVASLHAEDLREALESSRRAIRQGAALEKIEDFVEASGGERQKLLSLLIR